MKTRGEIEQAVCVSINKFEQQFMGRGPDNITTSLLGDLLVVRLSGALTESEKNLAKSMSLEKSKGLLKQMRTQLMEMARPLLEVIILDITGIKILSLHHDISTVTGEEVILFTLVSAPLLRTLLPKKRPLITGLGVAP